MPTVARPTGCRGVPQRLDELSGSWRRTALCRPGVPADTTTEVCWLQAGGLFVDLRIPAEPSGTVEGFAGTTLLADGVMSWQHLIDLRVAAGADVGRLRFAGEVLIESGVSGPYVEHWQRAQSVGAPAAGVLLRSRETHESAVVVRCGTQVGWAHSRANGAGGGAGVVVAMADVTPHGPVVRRSSCPEQVGRPPAPGLIASLVRRWLW